MLTLDDCLGLCDLTEEEILAIAEHEHISEMAALELGHYLVHEPGGSLKIRRMILDDIAAAEAHHDTARALYLKATLWHFIETHPDNPARKAPPAGG